MTKPTYTEEDSASKWAKENSYMINDSSEFEFYSKRHTLRYFFEKAYLKEHDSYL